MLVKTQGIVINYVKYRETSIIVKIYTESFGLKSFIVNAVRSHKAKANKMAYYQPLTLLDLVIYHKENRDINRISEVKVTQPFHSIPFNHKKNLIGIFLTEILAKILKEEEQDVSLFEFIRSSITLFDNREARFENFHIQFLIQLTRFLGITPQEAKGFGNFPGAEDVTDAPFFQVLTDLFYKSYDDFVEANGKIRTQILEFLLRFYQYHIESFGEVKSLLIIKELH